MTSDKSSAAPLSSLSMLHHQKPADKTSNSGSQSRNDSAGSAGSAGAGAGAILAAADRHGKQEEINEAMLGRIRGLEASNSKLEEMLAFLVDKAKSDNPKSGLESKKDLSNLGLDAKSATAALTALQQQRLSNLEAATQSSNSRLLGATEAQQKVLSDALKVSPASSDAGAAAAMSAFYENLQASASSAKAKLTDLAQAKNFEELNARLVDLIADGSTNKTFMFFIREHVKIIQRLNEHKGFACAKFYHYGVWGDRDKAEKAGTDDLNTFYTICATGHANWLSKSDKFADKGKGGGRGGRSGGGGGRGYRGAGRGNDSSTGDSFRGGRGSRGFRGGRGSTSPPPEPGLG
jgi:hypothetical protein